MEKKKKNPDNKTNQSRIWKNEAVSITEPEETNNILAKLSQHLQIRIFLQRTAEVSGAYEQLKPHSGCEH